MPRAVRRIRPSVIGTGAGAQKMRCPGQDVHGRWHLVSTSRWAAVLPDFSPFRSSRDFRLLFYQGTVTYFGSFMAMIALPLQIKHLTDSPLAVGAMGAVELVPLVVFGLTGAPWRTPWTGGG
ncbi:hypothetical protein SAVIM40S_04829 [Streptomyces avidinii]